MAHSFFSKKNRLALILIALVLLGSSFLFLYKLGVQPLHNDEARYSEVVTESFPAHDYFSLMYRGAPYFNKPPLLFWFMGASDAVLGNMQTAVRTPSALGGILLVIGVIMVVFEATESLYAAAFGGGVLATTASLILLARAGRFDTLASLFILVATYAFVRAFEDRRWFLLFGACIGLSIMTKGPVVFFALAACAGALLVYKRCDFMKDGYFWGGVVLALIIVLPWHIYETMLYGSEFWNVYVFQQIVSRAQENIVSISLPLSNWDYCTYFFTYLAPWTTIFVFELAALPFLWKHFSLKARVLLVASLAGIASVVVICFIVQSKAFRYLIPMYPFIAVCVGIFTFHISRLTIPNIRKGLVVAALFLGAYAFLWSAYNGFFLNPNYPYSTDTPATAQNEKSVAELLVAHKAPNFYVYNTANITAVMYYSRLIHPYYLPTHGYFPGLYFVLQTSDISVFENTHPRLQFVVIYQGTVLTLAQERGEAPECLVGS